MFHHLISSQPECFVHIWQVIDTMLGIGPMRDISIGDPVSSAPGAVQGQGSSRGPPQLVACSGQGKQGALSILRRSLVPELILKTSTPGAPEHLTMNNLK